MATRIRSTPPFRAEKPGTMHPLGLAGALAIEIAAERFVKEHSIADPAPRIAQQLSDFLRRRYGLQLATANGPSGRADPNQIVGAHASDDLVVEVWTDTWALRSVVPFPRQRTKYRLEYTALLRLVDARIDRVVDGKHGFTLARGSCSYSTKETPNAPTYDEFLAEGAHRLIDELNSAMLFCIDEFRWKVLAVSGSL